MRDKVINLVDQELRRAEAIHGKFNSVLEGYAVIKEEIEELSEDLEEINKGLDAIWRAARANCFNTDAVVDIYVCAVEAVQEAIQIAAMAKKFSECFSPQAAMILKNKG